VTFKAKAARGSRFAGWSGACTGPTCKITINVSHTVTARFTLKSCVVPKVTGKTLTAAKHALKAHFCAAGKVKEAFSRKVKKGRVISEKPKAGTHLRHGGKVGLTVSEGKK
jgi:beta-lactam-binding protein with PASTA domain